jgi:Tfp pilus assembly protein PilE
MNNNKINQNNYHKYVLCFKLCVSRYSGFTLVETLLYVAIVSSFLVMAVYFAWDIVLNQVKSNSIAEVNDNANIITQKISYYIQNAKNITTPANKGDVSQTLVLVMPDNSTATFDLSSGQLRLNLGSGAINLSSNSVTISNLSFTNLTTTGTRGNIKVKMDITNKNPSDKSEYNTSFKIDTSFSLRPN